MLTTKKTAPIEILSKTTIQTHILPYLTTGSRGFESKVPLCQIVVLILYRLKTGSQWRQLPIKKVFTHETLTWQGVFYHYNKWSKQGCWKTIWGELLKVNPAQLDLSCVQRDGGHTPTKRGEQAVGYQPRKSANTTNALFLANNTGQPLAIATPQAGNQHDLFSIQPLLEELGSVLQAAGIRVSGLFLNRTGEPADPGFDAQVFRSFCKQVDIEATIKPNPRSGQKKSTDYQYFDEELYQPRFVIEQTNGWLDGFKALLIRFETSLQNWLSLHWLAFCVLFLRKINRKQKV